MHHDGLHGLNFSIYSRSVSSNCPEDNPGRKLSYSVVGRRVALHCDLLVMVLHESEPGFPQILPGYLIAFIWAVNYTGVDLTHRPCCLYLKWQCYGYQFNFYSALPCSVHGVSM